MDGDKDADRRAWTRWPPAAECAMAATILIRKTGPSSDETRWARRLGPD